MNESFSTWNKSDLLDEVRREVRHEVQQKAQLEVWQEVLHSRGFERKFDKNFDKIFYNSSARSTNLHFYIDNLAEIDFIGKSKIHECSLMNNLP